MFYYFSSYIYVKSSLPVFYISHFLSFWHLFYFCPIGFLSLSSVLLILFSFLSILPGPFFTLITISKMHLSFLLIVYWVSLSFFIFLFVHLFDISVLSFKISYLEVFFHIYKCSFKTILFRFKYLSYNFHLVHVLFVDWLLFLFYFVKETKWKTDIPRLTVCFILIVILYRYYLLFVHFEND